MDTPHPTYYARTGRFSNCSNIFAFSSFAARDAYVSARIALYHRDLNSHIWTIAITRREARTLLSPDWVGGVGVGCYLGSSDGYADDYRHNLSAENLTEYGHLDGLVAYPVRIT